MATKEQQKSPQKPLDQKTVSFKKKLEFGLIIWKFKNIQPSVQAAIRHVSPIFKIERESECRWILKLDCKLYEENQERIYLYLKRCSTAEGPKKVPVSFRFGFKEGNSDIVWAIEDKQHVFEMKDKQSMPIPGIEECFKSILSTTDITICCAMTAFYGDYSEKKSEPELLKLSDDFLSIYEKSRMPDKILYCEGGTFLVHKAILAARSKYFEKLFESPDNETLDVCGVQFDMMNDLISFIYSGKWESVLKDFVPTDLKIYAKWFNITDLYERFLPEEITILDRNDYERVEYTWQIKNFSLLKNDKRISSPTFRSCSSELSEIPINVTAWLEENNELVISLTCLGFEVVYEVCIVDAKGQKCFEGNFPDIPTPGTPARFKFNMNKLLSKDRELYLPQDTLTVYCSVNFHKDKDESIITTEKCMRVEDPSYVTGIEKLVKDIENLLKTKLYSDLSLNTTKKKKHKVHKVILANRPSELQPKIASLDKSTNSLYIRLPDKELENLVLFAYTGKGSAEK